MHAVLLTAGWLASTLTVVFLYRRRWAHRCAECAWRHRQAHTTGRHRPGRLALPAATAHTDELMPPAVDPDATSPMFPVPSRPYPSPYPRALPTGRR